MSIICENMEYEKSFVVTEKDLAKNIGSGDVTVLATPAMIAYIENTASEFLAKFTEEGIVSVGSYIAVTHEAPTPLTMQVNIKIKITKIEKDKIFSFEVEAFDEKQLIGKGVHTRILVNAERFTAKAISKL